MEIGVIQNVVTELVAVWCVNLQRFAQIRFAKGLQMGNKLLVPIPLLRDINESLQVLIKHNVRQKGILKQVHAEIRVVQSLYFCKNVDVKSGIRIYDDKPAHALGKKSQRETLLGDVQSA